MLVNNIKLFYIILIILYNYLAYNIYIYIYIYIYIEFLLSASGYSVGSVFFEHLFRRLVLKILKKSKMLHIL